MKKYYRIILFIAIVSSIVSCQKKVETTEGVLNNSNAGGDPLPSWNEGETKSAIIGFVNDVTDPKSQNFISVEERIATFDNDGNLWSEQPMYFQLFFAIDRVKAMAPEHPEWQTQQPFKAVLENDMPGLIASGHKGLLDLMMTTHAGLTSEEFEEIVRDWLENSSHPRFKQPYNKLIYQPMLELLTYLRANDFKTFIVSGGGIDFMRVWTAQAYGIPPDQVVGSSIKAEFDFNNGNPVIKKLPEVNFIDDKDGKPVGINRFIGQRPVFASGNSDGDLQMLQYATGGSAPGFALYLHHTDSVREYAYDKDSPVGRLDKGLIEAKANGWTVISMKDDWKVIYPFQLGD